MLVIAKRCWITTLTLWDHLVMNYMLMYIILTCVMQASLTHHLNVVHLLANEQNKGISVYALIFFHSYISQSLCSTYKGKIKTALLNGELSCSIVLFCSLLDLNQCSVVVFWEKINLKCSLYDRDCMDLSLEWFYSSVFCHRRRLSTQSETTFIMKR